MVRLFIKESQENETVHQGMAGECDCLSKSG